MAVVSGGIKEFIESNIRNFPSVRYTMEGEEREQSESMGSVATGLIFVFFAIYSLLAIPFKSYLQPLIVMSIIPFGTIGAILGHWIMGMPLTFFSVLGMLALIGVVINDSLVLVDFINQRRKKTSVIDAITQAGVARFRPVLLTSLTTFFGLIPLLFEQSTQAQFLIPMAVSLAFGILFATFITLILVPINYLVAYELYQKVKGKR
jgi:multidrug efflux pump subunit AcrB